MKKASRFAFVAAWIIIAFVGRAIGVEPPRIIPYSGIVNKPVDQVFQTLKGYFSDPGLSKFNLVSAEQSTGTIVAKQTGIDLDRWRQWAVCQTDPMHMLYQFDDGTVTVTVTLKRDAQNTTFGTVAADFAGTYGLAQDRVTIECRSTGALERDILTVAGAQAAPSSP